MTRPHRSATVSLLAAVAAGLALWTGSVHGFDLDVHRSILRAALPGLSSGVMADIEGDFFSGSGNVGSDLYPNAEYRHLDNAATPLAICLNVDRAWYQFTNTILYNVRQGDFGNARSAFGSLTHVVQDFYSHANWLEVGRRNTALFAIPCNGAALPAGLQTGYFLLTPDQTISGCPTDSLGRPAPPFPFTQCHLTLNKDGPTAHGADVLPEGGRTFYAAAVDLAVAETRNVYNMVRTLITTEVTPARDDLSGACMADLLFGTTPGTGTPSVASCLDLSGVWTNVGSTPPNVGGSVWTLSQIDSLNISGLVQTQTCGVISFQVRRTYTGSPQFDGTMTSCSQGPTGGACQDAIQLPLSIVLVGIKGRVRAELTAIDVDETANECREVGRTVQYISLAR